MSVKWRICFAALFLPCLVQAAGPNLTTFWASDGGDKIPQEQCFPTSVSGSTSTISRTWSGTGTITPFSALNETAHFEVIACDTGTNAANQVTVQMSSLTCTSDGIANSVVRSSTSVNITTGTPVQVYSRHYVLNQTMSTLPLGRNEYEERQYPVNMRVPCTVTAGHCIPNGTAGSGTYTWTSRKYANEHIPILDVPQEEFSISSQTVSSGTSQSWDVDIYVSSSMAAPEQCMGTFSIFEGATLSTAMPVNLKLYNVKLPPIPHFPVVACTDAADIDRRMVGIGACSQPLTGQCLAAMNSVAQVAHAHNIQLSCDAPDSTSNYFPSTAWQTYTTGSEFTAANGYGNARGIGQPNNYYLIGQYGGPYWSNFEVGASSWAFYCSTNSINCAVYTPVDESFSAAVPTQSELLSTSTASQYNGYKLGYMQTDQLPDTIYGTASGTAPYVSWPASTNTGYDNSYPSSTTWDVLASSIMAGHSLSGSTGLVWRYNGAPSIGSGVMYPYEEEGYVPRANFWIYMKKLCPNGVCKGGEMLYESVYWRNVDNGGSTCGNGNLDDDVNNNSITFGYCTGSDAVWGMSGFNISQGDGVLFYPGQDKIYPASSYGSIFAMTGPVANAIRQGDDDVDIYTEAYAVNPSSATAVVNSVVSLALWEATCVTPVDCTYTYGDRSWSYGTNTWVQAEESLLQIAAGNFSSPLPADTISGPFKFGGGKSTLR